MIYGLVGRSGSGKSTAAEVFAAHGFFVIDCDAVAAEVLAADQTVKDQLAKAFGRDIISDGAVDKKLLASRAFADTASVLRLNTITHPPIVERIRLLSEPHARVLLDAPTLFESGADRLCERVIAVVAPENACRERIRKRDGLTHEQADMRLARQKTDEYLRGRADIIVENDGDEDEFRKRIEHVAETV